MKKLILLVIALLCFPVLTLANEGKGDYELDGEWYVSVINPDNVLDATIDDEGNYHIFDMNAGEAEELIIKQDGTYELEGYEHKFSISRFGDATFFYIDNNGLSGMGVLLPNDKDEEKRCRFYYFYDVTRVLLMNGKLYGYQGEGGIFDEGTEYDYYTDGRNIYFIEGIENTKPPAMLGRIE